MSAVLPQIEKHLTHAEYLDLEQQDDLRYEYIAGEVFAMAGGSESHALISANILGMMINALRDRPCRVYGSDMKLNIEQVDKFCYPDLQVLCEKGRRNASFVEGPALVVEVLSRSTEPYDRGLKFEHYRQIPELRYYLLLNQERHHAELFERRDDGGWLLTEYSGPDAVIRFGEWQIELLLAEIYRDVEFVPVISTAPI